MSPTRGREHLPQLSLAVRPWPVLPPNSVSVAPNFSKKDSLTQRHWCVYVAMFLSVADGRSNHKRINFPIHNYE